MLTPSASVRYERAGRWAPGKEGRFVMGCITLRRPKCLVVWFVMFLRTRLHKYLLWGVLGFGTLAIVSSFFDGGSSSSSTASSSSSVRTIPGSTTTYVPREYTVLPGDSLYSIAEKFNLSAPGLVTLNKIKNPDRVPAGTVLKLPPSAGFVPIGATTTMPP